MAQRFKLPPPYDPSRIYAIPAYMKAEGLTNRAMVTKWAPRGTYDNPDAFDPSWDKSYAQPRYMLDEGYGQGAKVTEWKPRGYYDGDIRRAQKLKTVQKALGDDAGPEPFAQYGRRAAAVLMRRVAQVPPTMRKDFIKRTMSQIDPALYNKAEAYANQHAARGVSAAMALELGVARAMSEGIGKELIDLGKKGGRPPAKGQVGLGCYGCAALGADLLSTVLSTPLTAVAQVVGGPAIPAGTCSADGRFIYKMTAGGYAWVRRSATDQCTGAASAEQSPTTGGAAGGVTSGGTTGAAGATAAPTGQLMEIGPIKAPLTYYSWVFGGPLPPAWADFLIKSMIKNPNKNAEPGSCMGALRDFFPNLPTRINQDFVCGELKNCGDTIATSVANICAPLVLVERPDTAEEWGIYLEVRRSNVTKPWDSTTNPYIAVLSWKPKDTRIQYPWELIERIRGKIHDAVKDVLDEIGKVGCELMSSPGAGTAAAGVASAYGVPPQVGADGAAAAQQACTGPPQLPPPQTAGESIMPLVIAGGAVAAIYFLTRKKQ